MTMFFSLCLLCATWVGFDGVLGGDHLGPWPDAVAYRMLNDSVTKERVTRAANWLKIHLVTVSLPGDYAVLSETLVRPPGKSETESPRHSASPFAQRGYYVTFMRMPGYDPADWKRIVDGIHDDGGNTLLLWVGGAFRSQRFPIT
jgi:hypothetical protein